MPIFIHYRYIVPDAGCGINTVKVKYRSRVTFNGNAFHKAFHTCQMGKLTKERKQNNRGSTYFEVALGNSMVDGPVP